MITRNEQKEQRRERILEVALDLFIHKGLAATKISDIAKAADMSVGLLFHYFESKERLYEELVNTGISRSNTALVYKGVEPLQFFEQVAKAILDQLINAPNTAKMFLLMSQAANCEILTEETRRQIWDDNLLHSAKIIKLGQANHSIRSGEPLALSTAFWGAILGVCQIIIHNQNYPQPSYDWVVDIIREHEVFHHESTK